ncbi:hypothetical protein LOK49_LG04G02577 [Camellia lanceoleosa]|uniref:Uncharacterized protein n=1 Tax=Camellia lanceoleosa TaxID=1840588 RepID=A0ACC0I258_9ERIC|nr:hypothetical protein LOK49_LG04G02577 [Camellia lanceoleosa]
MRSLKTEYTLSDDDVHFDANLDMDNDVEWGGLGNSIYKDNSKEKTAEQPVNVDHNVEPDSDDFDSLMKMVDQIRGPNFLYLGTNLEHKILSLRLACSLIHQHSLEVL